MSDETAAADTGQETGGGGGMAPDAARAKMDEISATLADEPEMKGKEPYRFKSLMDERRRLAGIVVDAEERENPTEFETEEEARAYLEKRQKAAAIRKDDMEGGEQRLTETHAALDDLRDATGSTDLGLGWLDDAEMIPPGVDAAVRALGHVTKGDLGQVGPLLDEALDGMHASAEARDAVRQVMGADLPEGLRAMLAADVLFWALDAHAPQPAERSE